MYFFKKLGGLILLTLLCNGGLAASEDAAIEDSPNRDLTGFEGLNERLPLWEAGVGGGMIVSPNYPASSERNFVALALPYVIYRGDIFRDGKRWVRLTNKL